MNSFSLSWCRLCIAILVVFILLTPSETRGAVKDLTLPTSCADFAYNPDTASLVALDNEKSVALVFSLTNAMGNTLSPIATFTVGESPCSVCYKKFGERHFFIIACSQESTLFILEESTNATSPKEQFQLVKKLELEERGISSISASINPSDPNVYYCYGGGHTSAAGAISLKSFSATRFVLRDTMDCAVSSSGTVLYHRGPWSPSGFRSLIRQNSVVEESPEFSPLFGEHRATPPYQPDAVDTYTASGTELYNRDLSQKIASLPIVPLAFFKTKPIIIGIKPRSIHAFSSGEKGEELKLLAVSTNSFKLVGTAVPLNHRLATEARLIQRSVSSNGDFKRIAYVERTFPDDSRKRVLFADGNKVFVVDLDEFELPDEPFLSISVPESLTFVAAEEHSLNFEIADSRVKLSIDNMPEGMSLENNKLSWKPKLEQVGSYTISPKLSSGELQFSKPLNISVEFPSTTLPYKPGGFFISESSAKAIIWEGDATSNSIDSTVPGNEVARNSYRLSVVDLKTGKIEAEKTLTDRIGSVRLFKGTLITKPITNGTHRCDIFELHDLKRVKSIALASEVHAMELIGEYLGLQTSDGKILVYDTKGFELVRTFERSQSGSPVLIQQSLAPQIYANGIVWGADLKPALILATPMIPALGNTRDFSRQASFANQHIDVAPVSSSLPKRGSETLLIARKPIPGAARELRLDYSQRAVQSSNFQNRFSDCKLTASIEGAGSASQVLRVSKVSVNNPAGRFSQTALVHVTSDIAYVVSDDRLYGWQFPRLPDEEAAENRPLIWSSKPTAVILEPTGKTELKHDMTGGKPPYSFNAPVGSPSILVDEKSGTVTIDNAALQSEAEQFLIQFISKNRREQSRVSVLRQFASELLVPASDILGRRPRGFPVACPIQLLVTDQSIGNVAINYFVVTEVNAAKIISELNRLDQLPPSESANQPSRAEPDVNQIPNSQGNTDNEIEKLNRKVQQLEERIELMTRQLNDVLKKLDERGR